MCRLSFCCLASYRRYSSSNGCISYYHSVTPCLVSSPSYTLPSFLTLPLLALLNFDSTHYVAEAIRKWEAYAEI